MSRHPNWIAQRFNSVSVDPNRGLALAQSGAKNISDIIASQQEAAATADYRQGLLDIDNKKVGILQDAQTLAQTADSRIAKKEKDTRILGNLKTKQMQDIINNTGFSRAPSFFANNSDAINTDLNYQDFTGLYDGVGPQQPDVQNKINDLQDTFSSDPNNKRLLSDPLIFGPKVLSKMLSSTRPDGSPLFNASDLQNNPTEAIQNLFTTVPVDVIKSMVMKPNGNLLGNNGTGTGTQANKFNSMTPLDQEKYITGVIATDNISQDKAFELFGFKPFDWGNQNIDKGSFKNYLSGMQARGYSVPGAVGALRTVMDEGATPFDINNIPVDIQVKLDTVARGINNSQVSGGNQNGGYLNQVAGYNSKLLSQINPDRSTREKRLAAYLSGVPRAKTVTKNPKVPTVDKNTHVPKIFSKDGTVSKSNNPILFTENSTSVKNMRKELSKISGTGTKKGFYLQNKAGKRARILTENIGRAKANSLTEKIIGLSETKPESLTKADLNDTIKELKKLEDVGIFGSTNLSKIRKLRSKMFPANRN